jgi:hypothetical protein
MESTDLKIGDVVMVTEKTKIMVTNDPFQARHDYRGLSWTGTMIDHIDEPWVVVVVSNPRGWISCRPVSKLHVWETRFGFLDEWVERAPERVRVAAVLSQVI